MEIESNYYKVEVRLHPKQLQKDGSWVFTDFDGNQRHIKMDILQAYALTRDEAINRFKKDEIIEMKITYPGQLVFKL